MTLFPLDTVRELVSRLAEQQAMRDDWWQKPLESALTEIKKRQQRLSDQGYEWERRARKAERERELLKEEGDIFLRNARAAEKALHEITGISDKIEYFSQATRMRSIARGALGLGRRASGEEEP